MPESFHLDPELAAKADRLFRELGLDLRTAIDLFLRQSLRENGLPFTLRLTTHLAKENSSDQPVSSPVAAEAPFVLEKETAFSPTMEAEHSADAPRRDEPDLEHFEPFTSPAEEERPIPSDNVSTPLNSHAESHPQLGGRLSDLRQAFLDMGLIGTPLRRVRSMNRLYAMGEENAHVPGWRECYVSGDEPFALDFGSLRIEMGFRDGGSLRMMDGRLPDEVLEADAIFPRDLSAVFSSVAGQRLSDVDCVRVRREGRSSEQLRLRFTNGCTLTFAPEEDWCALWLSDPYGNVMFAPDTVWMRTLGERTWQELR